MPIENLENHLNQCRCCLRDFDDSQLQVKIDGNIYQRFYTLTGLQLKNSKLYSRKICSFCDNLLLLFHNYRYEFAKNHRKLEGFVSGPSKKVSTNRIRKRYIDDIPGSSKDLKTELIVKVEPIDVKMETEDNLNPVSVFVDAPPMKTESELDQFDYNLPIPTFLTDELLPSNNEATSNHRDDNFSEDSWETEPLPEPIKKQPRKKPKKKLRKINCTEPNCNKYFLENHKLEEHIQYDHLGIPFQCTTCKFKTHTRELLNLHILRIHQGAFVNTKPKEMCPECGVMVSSISTHIKHVHIKNHPIMCDICGFRTFAIYLIRRHIYSAHFPKELKKRIECPICKKKLINSAGSVSLKQHLKQIHGTEQQRVTCHCGLSYKNEQYLKNHQRIVHEKKIKTHRCEICNKEMINASQFKEHMYKHKVDGRKEWACDICGKLYGSESLMLGHQVFHQEPKYPCTYENCGKKFHRTTILKRHIKNVHEIETTECEHCGKTYNIMHMPRHNKEFHSGLQRSMCLIPGCVHNYHRRDHMKGHIKRVHQQYMESLNNDERELFWKNFQKLPMV